MDAPVTVISANPAGESKNTASYPPGSWPLDTPGGRFFAEWDDQAPVTREGQLIFFFQFLFKGAMAAAMVFGELLRSFHRGPKFDELFYAPRNTRDSDFLRTDGSYVSSEIAAAGYANIAEPSRHCGINHAEKPETR